jgi:hypothetical protein
MARPILASQEITSGWQAPTATGAPGAGGDEGINESAPAERIDGCERMPPLTDCCERSTGGLEEATESCDIISSKVGGSKFCGIVGRAETGMAAAGRLLTLADRVSGPGSGSSGGGGGGGGTARRGGGRLGGSATCGSAGWPRWGIGGP